jgi:predicted TIM-barrel fold metal-dependent hydrolase
MTRARRKAAFTRRALLGAGVTGSATWLLRPPARAQPPQPVIVDVHAHTFNASDLPLAGFTAHFVPFLSDFSREIWDRPERIFRELVGKISAAINLVAPTAQDELAALQGGTPWRWPDPVADSALVDQAADKLPDPSAWLAQLIGPGDLRAMIRRAAQVVNLTAHPRSRITASVAAAYPGVSLFIPMLVDYDNWAEDKARSPLADQIKVHGDLARKSITSPVGAGGARLHPFVAFDPLRSDALDLVKTAIETQGFIGVKVYPPVGFAPARNTCLLLETRRGDLRGAPHAASIDAALDALYGYCTRNDVPITTHCSTGNEFGLGLRDLVEPRRWEPVLERFKTLRLNLGHFGHMAGIDAKRGLRACEAWLRQASYLMDRYPNVYADLSGSDLNLDGTAGVYARLLQQAIERYGSVPKRMMYGSDWWLNRFFAGGPEYLDKFKANFSRLFPGDNDLLADVLGRNALRFLGLAKDGGGRAANGDRLAHLYQAAGQALPPWLAG